MASVGYTWWSGPNLWPSVESRTAWVDCRECLLQIATNWVMSGSYEWQPLLDWLVLGCPGGWLSVVVGGKSAYFWVYAPIPCKRHAGSPKS